MDGLIFGHRNAFEACTTRLQVFEASREISDAGGQMSPNEIVRWSNPSAILVATNFLEGPTLMLHAVSQARPSNAKLFLVHVTPPVSLRGEAADEFELALQSAAIRAAQSKLDETVKGLLCKGVSCEPVVLTGLPVEQISKFVKSHSVDRVIAASRYASGVARFVEASMAEELVATLDVPVCIIGRHALSMAGCGARFERVLFATSFHSTNSRLVNFASTLTEVHGARLTVLHVIDSEEPSEQRRAMARFEIRRRLASLVPKEARHKYQPALLIREGDPATVILDEARTSASDLVIIGSPSGATQLLDNDVVHRVVTESACPVITVKFGSADSLQAFHKRTGTESIKTLS
jgi:nucleotide-binding universal stress UspA family protein